MAAQAGLQGKSQVYINALVLIRYDCIVTNLYNMADTLHDPRVTINRLECFYKETSSMIWWSLSKGNVQV